MCARRLAVPEMGDVVLRETVLDVPVISKPAVVLSKLPPDSNSCPSFVGGGPDGVVAQRVRFASSILTVAGPCPLRRTQK
jgi:hypothetical protein